MAPSKHPDEVIDIIEDFFPDRTHEWVSEQIFRELGIKVSPTSVRRLAHTHGVEKSKEWHEAHRSGGALAKKVAKELRMARHEAAMAQPDLFTASMRFEDDPEAVKPEPRLRVAGYCSGYVPYASSAATCAEGSR